LPQAATARVGLSFQNPQRQSYLLASLPQQLTALCVFFPSIPYVANGIAFNSSHQVKTQGKPTKLLMESSFKYRYYAAMVI